MTKFKMSDWRTWLVLSCFVLMSACAGKREMMPTPNIHVEEGTALYEGLSAELQSTQVPVYYVTDRMPERTEQ